jgi:hypothetical protein
MNRLNLLQKKSWTLIVGLVGLFGTILPFAKRIERLLTEAVTETALLCIADDFLRPRDLGIGHAYRARSFGASRVSIAGAPSRWGGTMTPQCE